MLHKRRSFGTRKVSPPQPTCMTDEQKATYLSNLRNNRPARPGGARPLIGRHVAVTAENNHSLPRSESVSSLQKEEATENATKRYSIPISNSMPLIGTLKRRPLVQAPDSVAMASGGMTTPLLLQRPGELGYRQSVSREKEKQEAHSIREALEGLDHEDEETRIYTAAQQEAADLVWRHINPRRAEQEKTAAYRNPDLRKNHNHALAANKTSTSHRDDTGSKSLVSEAENENDECKVEGLKLSKRGSRNGADSHVSAIHNSRRRSSGKRDASNGSNKGVFRNPEDHIYEEPEEIEVSIIKRDSVHELPLQSKPRNTVLQGSRPLLEKTHSVPLPERSKFDRFEIHRNAPSQSRNGEYTANAATSREVTPDVETPKGRAMEIRSDEIRAATSMRRKDRSPKLPTPTAVSDRPGRPIVSFDPGWKPGHESPKTSLDMERRQIKQAPPPPVSSQSAPVIPTINLPDDNSFSANPADESIDVPLISVSAAPSVPVTNLPGDDAEDQPVVPSVSLPDPAASRPLPQMQMSHDQKSKARPLPPHSHSSPARLPLSNPPRNNRVPWLTRNPAVPGATVTCNACQLPISGRIVTASGSTQEGPKARFHPECFTCFHCSTALECVSFYPEPQTAREERLQQDQTADPAEMRFFCHLDYHDLFSPRCASCKTPIEGAVVLAAGKSWHEGHFFCAECGDPFSSSSPFVEDKGYAYCVGCHTKRTSARCRGCKKQILGEICVEALGGKWHEECFRCDECAGDFGNDGRFFVREVEIELTDKERRKGLTSKFEERACCERCETLRLRRVNLFL